MKSIILLAMLFCTSVSFAQTTIRGRITDQQTGEPLSGATVSSGTAAASASENGDFEIAVPSATALIKVSFIGYETQELKLPRTARFLNITLNSNNINLSTVRVTGYDNNRKLLQTAGSIGILKAKDLQRGDNTDIMNALNTIPGVKMEAYSVGNYRISIRGSLLNNPWGVRNVRVYWNDIPLSSPDGTAQKSIDFDPAIIGSVEVLKGPSGSMYGAGNGGVLLVKNTQAVNGQNTLEAGYTAGSYGLSRFQVSYKTAGENFNIAANVVGQRYDGYRENNWGNKDVLNLFAQYTPGENRTLNFFVTHVTGSLGIAGGISKEQMDSMPRQALQYNKDNKISVKKYDATALGASQTYRFTTNFSNTTSVYGNFQTYDHPFGSSIYYNGFLKESMTGYGARTKFLYTPSLGKIRSRFSLGGEYQYQHQFGNTFTIVNDQPGTWPEPGTVFQNDIVKSTSKILFAQAEFDLPSKIFVTLGASYTQLSYNILDLYRDSAHVDYSGLLKFPVKISPRIGVVKEISNHLAFHGSMSYGYSPPPVWELNNYDGSLNKDLKPEDGVNYELGVRGSAFKSKLNFDITVYQMHLKNAIVPVAQPSGTTAYKNAGLTNQKGVEAMLTYLVLNDANGAISLLKPWISYTYNHYRFTDYKTQSFDYGSSSVITVDNSGKAVTGVVPNSLSAGIDLETKYGIYFNTTCYYYDKIPLNDANTYHASPYTLLHFKLGCKLPVKKMTIDISAGVNNALNASYSSLILYNAGANAFGASPQFYNPSPGTNYYAGIKIKYDFK